MPGEPAGRISHHHAVGVGRDRKPLVVVADEKRPALVLEPQLLPLEHGTVLVAENRNQHLVGELGLHRVPLDIEEVRVARARAVLEDVQPPGVGRLRDAHVIGHHVEHVPHGVRVEPSDPCPVVLVRAERRPLFGQQDQLRAVGRRGPREAVRRGEVALLVFV